MHLLNYGIYGIHRILECERGLAIDIIMVIIIIILLEEFSVFSVSFSHL